MTCSAMNALSVPTGTDACLCKAPVIVVSFCIDGFA